MDSDMDAKQIKSTNCAPVFTTANKIMAVKHNSNSNSSPNPTTNDKHNQNNICGHLTMENKLNFRFNNISYKVKQNNKSKLKQILYEMCGEFKSHRLTAVLGPSGAGKTSMLNVLAGFKATGVTGQFTLNGQDRDLLSFRLMSSYIPQDFVMHDLLTVEETLKVSMDLKLSTTTTLSVDKQKILDDILEICAMSECRHTLVRDISGGERKRLSIGIELVTNPPLMFFDEPTSGLDSVASLQVMNHLRRLARDGRIVVCVVHQPSSRLMQLFDDVVVVSRGEVLYAGPQQNILPYFAQSGFICPSYYNPADFVVEIASEPQTEKIIELIQRNKVQHLTQKSAKQLPQIEVDENVALLSKDSNGDHASIDINMETTIAATAPNSSVITTDSSIRPKEQVNCWRQFSVLMRRHLLTMARNKMAVQLRLHMHIVVGFLLGVVYWDMGNDASKVLSNTSCIFFVVLFLFSGNAMPSILLCQQEPAVFIREYLNGWYSLPAYYISKVIADLPMQMICPTAFIAIVYYMTGQPLDWYRFCICWVFSIITTIVGHFIGLICGSTFNIQMAIFLVPSITIPFLLFSGFFVRMSELSWFLRPICDISFFRYVMEALLRAIYGFDRDDLECADSFCYYKSPEKFLQDMSMLGNNIGVDVLALVLFVSLLKVIFYVSLRYRIYKAM